MIIFHLSKRWKAKFFIVCHVIFLVRLPGGGGGGTPIYFLGRDVPTVRVSFSGSSILNRVYIFRFLCLEQGRPRKCSPFLPLRSHNFRWFRAPSLKCVKTQTYVQFLVFWIRPAWSSLEQGKKLQHLLLDRVAKFTSFVSWTGSGFHCVGRPPLPKFLLKFEVDHLVNVIAVELKLARVYRCMGKSSLCYALFSCLRTPLIKQPFPPCHL